MTLALCLQALFSQDFITVMDQLRLESHAKDELQPNLKNLSESMNRMVTLPTDFEGRSKVNAW